MLTIRLLQISHSYLDLSYSLRAKFVFFLCVRRKQFILNFRFDNIYQHEEVYYGPESRQFITFATIRKEEEKLYFIWQMRPHEPTKFKAPNAEQLLHIYYAKFIFNCFCLN